MKSKPKTRRKRRNKCKESQTPASLDSDAKNENWGCDVEVPDPENEEGSDDIEVACQENKEGSSEAEVFAPPKTEAETVFPTSFVVPIAPPGHEKWLSIACEKNSWTTNSGGIVIAYTSEKFKVSPKPGDVFQGSFSFQHDTGGSTPIECSIIVAKDFDHARSLFKSAIGFSHEGIASAYFVTYCYPIKKYVVIYELLANYGDESVDLICSSNGSIKLKWLVNIRNIFGGLESLHKMGLSHPLTSERKSYMWSKRNPEIERSTRLIGANGRLGVTGLQAREERIGVLSFLECLKITECEDYPSLKELVKSSFSSEAVLGHPLLIGTDSEKVDCYYMFHEAMYRLTPGQLADLLRKLNQQFPGLPGSWKEVVKCSEYLKSLKVDGYGDTFEDLLRFIRNYIEHKRDSLLCKYAYIDFKKMVFEFSAAFPKFFGWVYTYMKLA